MYFDFEDYRPDIFPVGRALTRLEVVLLSIIFHLVMVIFIILSPKYFPKLFAAPVVRPLVQQAQPERQRFVFVQPKLDRPAPKPPARAELSDLDRQAQAPRRAERPQNPLPYARGNSPERTIEDLQRREAARGRGPAPDPAAGQIAKNEPPQQAETPAPKVPESQSKLQLPSTTAQNTPNGANGRSATSGGSLGDALRNLQRYVQTEAFENQSGGGGQFGPEIQFDTKGVEFGPWIRRFIAQVKRNWFIPYAAMSMKGHVVITFNVHKDGALTDVTVVGPCPIDAFNNAAFGALAASNPTQPLPPEYPSERAFFTVTFFYNESPR
jgi:TonB family protein